MESARKFGILALLAAGVILSGCGMPGAPKPPSLDLPQPVADLRAERTGATVALDWSMPRRNTDKLLLKAPVAVRICRAAAAGCDLAGTVELQPGVPGHFLDTLPAALSSGKPRALEYFVELDNHRGRSAGASNHAAIVAGAAPKPVTQLTAQVRKAGVVLHWQAESGDATPVRLRRKLLTPLPKKTTSSPLDAPTEPRERTLLVRDGLEQGRALDATTTFGMAYEYQAQRVTRVQLGDHWLELEGALSVPARVEVKDIFPPDAPEGLAAVAMSDASGAAVIDLNWQPGTESDLAGYIVYRREGDGDWRRISPEKPLVGPAFRDAAVLPGHRYLYAVSAVDQGGHEGQRSAEAAESAPEP